LHLLKKLETRHPALRYAITFVLGLQHITLKSKTKTESETFEEEIKQSNLFKLQFVFTLYKINLHYGKYGNMINILK
jgi:fatty acid/phospholipid biosynthesis enzyme